MEFLTYTPTVQVSIRSPGLPVREVELGETLELRTPVASVALKSAPAGTPPTIQGLQITPAVLGLHRFVVTSATGERCDLLVFCFEPACVDMVPARQRSGRCGEDRTRAERRLVVRSIVQHHDSDTRWFTGAAASIPGHALDAFGG